MQRRIIDNHNGRLELAPAGGRMIDSAGCRFQFSDACCRRNQEQRRTAKPLERSIRAESGAKSIAGVPAYSFINTVSASGGGISGAASVSVYFSEVLYEQLRQLLGFLLPLL